jgi:hypothetical protein
MPQLQLWTHLVILTNLVPRIYITHIKVEFLSNLVKYYFKDKLLINKKNMLFHKFRNGVKVPFSAFLIDLYQIFKDSLSGCIFFISVFHDERGFTYTSKWVGDALLNAWSWTSYTYMMWDWLRKAVGMRCAGEFFGR